MPRGDWLKAKAPWLHRFLTRRDRPWPLLREFLGVALAILLVLTLVYGLTAQPIKGGYPVVVVTTGSMMHCTNGNPTLGSDCEPTHWGRLGTIDPGDLVFVRRVSEPAEVDTRAVGDESHYSGPGDVIVFHPNGNRAQTPVIHRALFWVQVNDDGTYSVPQLDIHNVRRLDQPQVQELTRCALGNGFDMRGTEASQPGERSGFVTRGDNNGEADQCHAMGLARMPWVIGKARGEIPWVGLVNLLWGDITGGSSHFAAAGGDSKVMFFAVVALLVLSPWAIEWTVRRRRERAEAKGKDD